MPTRTMPRVLAALPFLAMSFPLPAGAQWQPNGTPVVTAPGDQRPGKVISDGAGGAFVAWHQVPQPTVGPDFFVQHLTESGTPAPGWPSAGLPLIRADGVAYVTADGGGGLFLAWTTPDGPVSEWDVYASRIAGSGSPAPGWPVDGVDVCTEAGAQQVGPVAPDGAGGMFVAWADWRVGPYGGSTADLYVHHVLAEGVVDPSWPANGLGVSVGAWAENVIALTPDQVGGVVVVWRDTRDGGIEAARLYAQRLTSSGAVAPGWPAGGLSLAPGAVLDNRDITVVSDGSGGAIVVFDDLRNQLGSRSDIYAQRVTGIGSIAPGWPADGAPVCTAPSSQVYSRAVSDGEGGAIVGWLDYRDNLLGPFYYATRIEGTGSIASGWQPDGTPVCIHRPSPLEMVLDTDGGGGAYFAWPDYRDASLYDIYAQHLTADGTIAPGWVENGIGICTLPTSESSPMIAEAGPGRAIVAWADHRNQATTGLDIYAQLLTTDGPVPAQVSVSSTEVQPDYVRITWYAAGFDLQRGRVERRCPTCGWTQVGMVDRNGDGRLMYEDHDVRAGERLGYRLAWDEVDGENHSSETWIEIPTAKLGIRGFELNPSPGSARVALSLGSAAPAALEVFDIAGRRLITEDLGSLGPGTHSVSIATSARLRAGVYLMRLTQEGGSVIARGVVIE